MRFKTRDFQNKSQVERIAVIFLDISIGGEGGVLLKGRKRR